jgi:hypothetical protein
MAVSLLGRLATLAARGAGERTLHFDDQFTLFLYFRSQNLDITHADQRYSYQGGLDPSLVIDRQLDRPHNGSLLLVELNQLYCLIFLATATFVAIKLHHYILWYPRKFPKSRTDYTVYLFKGQSDDGEKTYKVSVMNPDWPAKPVAGREIPYQVYLDSDSRKVAVIETEHGLLWNWSSDSETIPAETQP